MNASDTPPDDDTPRGFAVAAGCIHFVVAWAVLLISPADLQVGLHLLQAQAEVGDVPEYQSWFRLGMPLFVVGLGMTLSPLLGIVAGVGCLKFKRYGRTLSYLVGPLIVALQLTKLLAVLIVTSETDKVVSLAVPAGIGLFLGILYAGFTITATRQGIPR